MSRSLRAVTRLATATLLVTAGLVAAPPARAAAPLAVDVFCESLGRYRVLCERTVTGGTAPYKTRWHYNGSYFPSMDDKAFTSWSCTLSGPNQYTATVTDALGTPATDTSGVGCQSGNP